MELSRKKTEDNNAESRKNNKYQVSKVGASQGCGVVLENMPVKAWIQLPEIENKMKYWLVPEE